MLRDVRECMSKTGRERSPVCSVYAVVLCESMHPGHSYHLVDKLNLFKKNKSACETAYNNSAVHLQHAHTLLKTKFVSHTLYSDPRVRVKSEVYFGLYCHRFCVSVHIL